MESKEVKAYLSAIYFFGISIFLIGGSIFYGIIGDWDFNGFGGMTLITFFIGLFFLIFGILALFEARGRKWAKIAQRIIWIIIALSVSIMIIAGLIVTT